MKRSTGLFATSTTMYANPSARVGDRVLLGRHGGAYVQHYEIVSIDRESATARLEAIRPISVNFGDGTFSTRWERGLEG